MAVANKIAGKPVVLIAVNSGNSRGRVQSYARQNRITIPIIVDTNRALEKQLGVTQISLQNIWAAAILNSEGRVERASARDLQAAADRALRGASWNVDPEGMPLELRNAWQAVEFGNYSAASSTVRKRLQSPKAEVKEAAERLNDYVQKQIARDVELAEKAVEAEHKFEAYRRFSAVRSQFKGFALPDDLSETIRKLAEDDTVKKEVAAMKRLNSALQSLSSSSPSGRKKAQRILETLVRTDGDTEAGAQAKKMLNESAP